MTDPSAEEAPDAEDWVSPDYPRTPCADCGASSWAWSARRGRYICLRCEYGA